MTRKQYCPRSCSAFIRLQSLQPLFFPFACSPVTFFPYSLLLFFPSAPVLPLSLFPLSECSNARLTLARHLGFQRFQPPDPLNPLRVPPILLNVFAVNFCCSNLSPPFSLLPVTLVHCFGQTYHQIPRFSTWLGRQSYS